MASTFDISARLKALRASSGLTQEEFAEYAGISYKFYQHIESGRKKLLRVDTIERICSAYKIALSDFFAAKLVKIALKTSKQRTGSPHNRKRLS